MVITARHWNQKISLIFMDFFNSIDFSEIIKQSQYTHFIIFFIAFLESFLLIGLLIPGSTILLTIGSLIATGYLDLWPTLFFAFLGAVMGDNISFWIGVYFQKPLKHSIIYQKHQNIFIKGEHFFFKYGIYSIVLGRFIGPIRAVIPAIAGSMGMSGSLFFLVNIISALLWAPIYIMPGYFIGTIYNHLQQLITLEISSLLFIIFFLLSLLLIISRSHYRYKKIAYSLLTILTLIFLAMTQITYPT
jgi:undecaprenyl-diphosphatase